MEVIKIKRKVVLHGSSTLTISLPANWAKKFNVKKGDELDVEEQNRELRISTEKEFNRGKKEFSIKDLKRLGKTYITSSYRQGYDEIGINYDDPNYISVIQKLISEDITGFEIIKQSKNNCLIRDLTGHSKDEFNIVLRRVWLLLTDLSKESLNAFRKNDVDLLKNIEKMDYSINKFSNYCLRLLIKQNHVNFNKTPLYYHLIKSLEEIADQYKDLCIFHLENLEKIDKKLISIFSEVNDHLNEFHELFYKYDEQKIEDFYYKIKKTQNKASVLKGNAACYLSSICNDIQNLLSVLVGLQL